MKALLPHPEALPVCGHAQLAPEELQVAQDFVLQRDGARLVRHTQLAQPVLGE